MKIAKGAIFANDYLLLERIGGGGYSTVWKAKIHKKKKAKNHLKINDQLEDEVLVIKIYNAGEGLDHRGSDIFHNEYLLLQELDHPNLLKAFDYGVYEGIPFLVLEYMENGSCQGITGKFVENDVPSFLNQVAGALEYLYDQIPPIIHQDIKPTNILIDKENQYRLADFGISTRVKNFLTKSREEPDRLKLQGTLPYMAPECFSDTLKNRQPSSTKDIYSLGVTIFELLTEKLPFGELGGLAQTNGMAIPNLPEEFSPGLNKLIRKCVDKEPYERPAASQLVDLAQKYEQTLKWDIPEKAGTEDINTKTALFFNDNGNLKEESENIITDVTITSPVKKKSSLKTFLIVLAISLPLVCVMVVLFWPREPGIYLNRDLYAGTLITEDILDIIPLKNPEKEKQLPYTFEEIRGKCLSCDTIYKMFRKGYQLQWKDIGTCAGIYLNKDYSSGTMITDTTLINSIKPGKGSLCDDRPTDFKLQLKNKGFRLLCNPASVNYPQGSLLTWKILERQAGVYLAKPLRPGTWLTENLIEIVDKNNSCDSIKKLIDIYPMTFTEIDGWKLVSAAKDTIYPKGMILIWWINVNDK